MLQPLGVSGRQSVSRWLPRLQVLAVRRRILAVQHVDLPEVSHGREEAVARRDVDSRVRPSVPRQSLPLLCSLRVVFGVRGRGAVSRRALALPSSLLARGGPHSRLLQPVRARHGPLPSGVLAARREADDAVVPLSPRHRHLPRCGRLRARGVPLREAEARRSRQLPHAIHQPDVRAVRAPRLPVAPVPLLQQQALHRAERGAARARVDVLEAGGLPMGPRGLSRAPPLRARHSRRLLRLRQARSRDRRCRGLVCRRATRSQPVLQADSSPLPRLHRSLSPRLLRRVRAEDASRARARSSPERDPPAGRDGCAASRDAPSLPPLQASLRLHATLHRACTLLQQSVREEEFARFGSEERCVCVVRDDAEATCVQSKHAGSVRRCALRSLLCRCHDVRVAVGLEENRRRRD